MLMRKPIRRHLLQLVLAGQFVDSRSRTWMVWLVVVLPGGATQVPRKDRLVAEVLMPGLEIVKIAVVEELVAVGIVMVVELLAWSWHLKSRRQRTKSSLV